MIEKMLDRPDPIDEIYVDKGGFVSDGTICQELREIYHLIGEDDKEAKLRVRVAMAMAKKIINRLFMYRNGEIGWKCKHCGDCCNRINYGIDTTQLDADTKDLMVAHGLSIEKPLVLTMEHKCQHLTDDKMCAIYDARPNVCKYFTCEKEDREKLK